jgi:hypothetical protein
MSETTITEKAGDVVDVATDRATLYGIGAAVVENLGEKLLFKSLPQIFGYALGDGKGGITFHPAKPNPAGTGDGKPTWVPQTAQSSTPLYARQGARLVAAGAAFAVFMGAKDRAVRTGALTFGILAGAHIVQDLIPPLRG